VIKAECSQASVSHDPSEITLIWWSDDQETLMIIISVLLFHIYVETDTFDFFKIILW